MHRAETIEQADFLLTVTGATVLLSDTIFLDGTCNLAAEMIGAVHRSVSLVVVTDGREDLCWERALRLSIGTVSKPLRIDELRRAIRTAHEIAEETAWRLSGFSRDA